MLKRGKNSNNRDQALLFCSGCQFAALMGRSGGFSPLFYSWGFSFIKIWQLEAVRPSPMRSRGQDPEEDDESPRPRIWKVKRIESWIWICLLSSLVVEKEEGEDKEPRR